MSLTLRRGMWPVPAFVREADFLPTVEWARHKDRLAEALDDENTWIVLAAFYYSLSQLRARALLEQAGTQLGGNEKERLQVMHDQATVLQAVLAEDPALPDDWQAQLKTIREAGRLPLGLGEKAQHGQGEGA